MKNKGAAIVRVNNFQKYDMGSNAKPAPERIENDLAGAGVDVKSMLRAASMSAQAGNQMSTV